MKKLRIGKIFDFVFGATFLFLMCFVWVRYFLHDFWITILLTGVITFLTIAIYHFFSKKKYDKHLLTEKEMQNASAISAKFLLMTKQEVLKEFCTCLNKKYKTEIKSDYIVINNNILRPLFFCGTVTDKDVIESYTKTKNIKADKLILVCKKADDISKAFAKNITDKKVLILEEFDAYENIYKPLNFEVPYFESTKKRKKTIDYLSFALCKARTKNYILVSAFLLISSFVLRYNIYYIVFASITTMLGLYSYFNKKFNSKKSNNYLI